MARWTAGTRRCQAAIFMYKNDSSVESVKSEIQRINTEQGKAPSRPPTDGIYGEHDTTKREFMEGLSDWNGLVDANNSFLCIYAHANGDGICPLKEYDGTAEYQKDLITWHELAAAVAKPVQYLWLLGCTTQECTKHWGAANGPVRGLLLATSAEVYWGDFVSCFEAEISLDPIRSSKDVINFIRSKYPNVAQNTHYFKPQTEGWVIVED
jgi:hypothetical protein